MAGSAAKGLGAVIASRRLRSERKGHGAIVVRLGIPRRKAADEWHCPFHLSGLGAPRLRRAVGVDAFQALMLALAAIYAELASSDDTVTWGEYGGRGISGFAPIVPHFMGPQFFRKVERMIERELLKSARKKVRRHKRPGKSVRTN